MALKWNSVRSSHVSKFLSLFGSKCFGAFMPIRLSALIRLSSVFSRDSEISDKARSPSSSATVTVAEHGPALLWWRELVGGWGPGFGEARLPWDSVDFSPYYLYKQLFYFVL